MFPKRFRWKTTAKCVLINFPVAYYLQTRRNKLPWRHCDPFISLSVKTELKFPVLSVFNELSAPSFPRLRQTCQCSSRDNFPHSGNLCNTLVKTFLHCAVSFEALRVRTCALIRKGSCTFSLTYVLYLITFIGLKLNIVSLELLRSSEYGINSVNRVSSWVFVF